MKKIGIVSIICVLVDQIIKVIIQNSIQLNESFSLIKNFFSLTYVRNYGAAWSIFSGNRFFLILIAFISIILIYMTFIKDKQIKKLDVITYGLLLGGIMGNLIDRVLFGYVIDYLDFYIFKYDYPIFNFADICIVISVFLLVIYTFRGDKACK